MPNITKRLHAAFLEPLEDAVEWHSDIGVKPLSVDLALPNPPRLRVYMYSLVSGGTVRPNEYKGVLRVPGQKVGDYGSFDHSGGRLALLVAYREDLDVFVLWDASLHPRFKNGGNVQVRDYTVHEAAALGRARQSRPLVSGVVEAVIACQSCNLLEALRDRVAWTGGFDRTVVSGR
ncbi:hypothetical protein [Symbioplanes lichenis]|uniref:hypothetical protein n=1 Tax=Symbioplanes lichenis TaxID=1629072 RepID=UPI0034DB2736